MADTVTRRGVELASVGDWPASGGSGKITRADLEDILAAAQDSDVHAAPIRIGHLDPRFDGEPALGWVRPTGIVEQRKDGRKVPTLIGDLVSMPSQFAAIAPHAWRRRSIGIAHGVKTAAGKTYRAALDHLALLGTAPPAISGLADVVALYAHATGPGPAEHVTRLEMVDGLEDNPVAVTLLTAARDAGATVAQLDAMAAAAGARDTADLPQPVDDPAQTHPHTPPAPNPGGPRMSRTLTDTQLRELLAREQDVDVEATLRQIRASETTPDGGNGDGGDGGGTEPPVNPETGTPQPANPAHEEGQPTPQNPGTNPAQPTEGTPPASQPSSSTQQPASESREGELVTLSAGQWAEVQRELGDIRQRRQARTLDDAVRSGRITVAERASFAAQMTRDEEGTTTLLNSLTPGRVPTTEVGHGDPNGAATGSPDDAAWDQFGESLGIGKLS